MQSSTCVLHPILGAFVALEELINGPRQWFAVGKPRGHSELQRRFLRYSGSHLEIGRRDLDLLRRLEGIVLKTKAATDAQTLRDFLAAEDISLPVEDFAPDEVGAAAYLKILVEWLMAGTPCQIVSVGTGEQLYPAFRIMRDHEVGNVGFYRVAGHPYDAVKLATETGVGVYITRLDEKLEGLDLLDRAIRLSKRLSSRGGYDGVVIPMVDLDQEVDIAWLKGMKTPGWFVAQALQRTKLKMNHLGALVESAAVVTSRKSGPPDDLEINGPFLMWMEAKGFSIPFFTARIAEADWKDPGVISGLGREQEGGVELPDVRRVRIPTIRRAG